MNPNAQQPQQPATSQSVKQRVIQTIQPSSQLPKILLTILGLVAVLGLIVGAYYLGTQKSLPIIPNEMKKIVPAKSITSFPTNIPTVATDVTANWKTYSYTKYGYSFKVPSGITVTVHELDPSENYILQSIDLIPGNMGSGGLIVAVQTAASLEEGIRNTQKFSTLSNRQQITINNQTWTSFNIGENNSETIYFLYINNKLYTVDGRTKGNGYDTEYIQQEISTFQFTN